MGPSSGTVPLGLRLTGATRLVSRAFDDALARAGGSLPMWLVLLNLERNPRANQRELAEAVGVREATLTHHLNAMESDGLVSRRRDPNNRRIHIVEVTEAGNALFLALRDAAVRFDGQLRRGLSEQDLVHVERVLDRLVDNVGCSDDGPPWAGLADTTGAIRGTGPTHRRRPKPTG